MAEPSDSQLLADYRAGSVAALEEVVARYRQPLFGFILKMCARRDEADEIFQEVWLRVIRGLDQYRDGRLLSWLFRIARNLVIDRYRARRPIVSLEDAQPEGGALQAVLADARPDAAQQLMSRETLAGVARAVERLPPAQKEVFLMRLEGDLPFREIARIQGVSINTALARMQYALARLRAALQAAPR